MSRFLLGANFIRQNFSPRFELLYALLSGLFLRKLMKYGLTCWVIGKLGVENAVKSQGFSHLVASFLLCLRPTRLKLGASTKTYRGYDICTCYSLICVVKYSFSVVGMSWVFLSGAIWA